MHNGYYISMSVIVALFLTTSLELPDSDASSTKRKITLFPIYRSPPPLAQLSSRASDEDGANIQKFWKTTKLFYEILLKFVEKQKLFAKTFGDLIENTYLCQQIREEKFPEEKTRISRPLRQNIQFSCKRLYVSFSARKLFCLKGLLSKIT